jgi:hypothetical protein
MMPDRALASPLAALALLSVWIGAALIVSAVVAPAAFAVLPTRTLAGALVGRVLPVLFWSGVFAGLASTALTWSLPSRSLRVAAGLAIAVASAIAQLGITPRIERIRVAIGGPIDSLAVDDARRLEFGRLHGLSVAMLGVATLAAVVAAVLIFLALASRSRVTT